MKKVFSLSAGLVFLLLASCHGGSSGSGAARTDSMVADKKETTDTSLRNHQTLITDSFRYSLKSGSGSCDIYLDYPVDGPKEIVDELRSFIRSTLFDDQIANIADDPEAITHEYCTRRLELQAKTLAQMGEGKVRADEAPEEGIELRLLCLTSTFVTYEVYRYSYTTHAAHGEYSEYGVTFRLSDGKRMSHILNKVDEGLYAHIREGLKRYFHVKTDAQLEALCTTDLSLLPMPTFPPYMVPEGVVLHYSIYDLCQFDDGDPKVLIPYFAARSYMTEEARRLIPEK